MTRKSKKSLQNRAFIQALSALSSSELKMFKSFCLKSSSISKETKSLFESIYKAAPNFEKLNEERLLSRFFPNKPKAKVLLNYAFYDLSELLRKWMIQKEVEADEYLQNQLFIRACKKRFLHRQFFKKTQQTLEALEKEIPVPNTWHKQFETNFNLFYHVQTPKNQPEVKSLSDMESNLEMFYYGSKIRLLCQQANRIKKLNFLPDILDEDLSFTMDFARKQGGKIPFFALYVQLIEYLQNPDMVKLNSFFQNFKKERTKLDRLDQTILIFVAAYSLNAATMKGNKTIVKMQFDLYKYAFENDLALFDNEMSDTPFNNFLVAACEVGEFKIAQEMLKKYKPYFNPKIKEEFTNLMQCTLFYYQRKYEKVELNLRDFQFKKPEFRIRSRNLWLKILYELFQKDSTYKSIILSELMNLKKYIQKQHRISESRKNIYYSMIFVIRKLTNAKHNSSLSRIKAKQELMNYLSDKSNNPISRNWLSEKIKEL